MSLAFDEKVKWLGEQGIPFRYFFYERRDYSVPQHMRYLHPPYGKPVDIHLRYEDKNEVYPV